MIPIYKTTVTPPWSKVSDSEAEEAFAALPIDDQMLVDAVSQAMGMLSAEHRAALREKIAKLEGQIDVLMSLLQGKGQIIDLPPLPTRKRHVA
jgi:hypothetical protein